MRNRAWWAGLVVVWGWALPAAAQVKLEWKLRQGDVFYAETVTTLNGTATQEGKPDAKQQRLVSVSTVVARFTVKEVTGDGYVLEERFFHAREKTSGGVIGPQLASFLHQLVFTPDKPQDKDKEITFMLKVSPAGKVIEFKGYAEAMRKIVQGKDKKAKIDARMLEMLKTVVTKEAFKRAAEQVFIRFPPEGKKEWQREEIDSLGALGIFEAKYKYTHQGSKDAQEQIRVTANMKYVPPGAKSSNLPFNITGGELTADKATGTIRFDARAGRLVRSEMEMHFKGRLTVKSGDTRATLRLEQDQTVVTRLLDRNPLP